MRNTIEFRTPKRILEKSYKLVKLECQEEARVVVASLLSNHLTYLEGLNSGLQPNDFPALSLLLYGGTGTGKSQLFKSLCASCGLQVITLDAANITATGFKGLNLNEALATAIQTCDSPDDFVNKGGVCIIDEIDKMATTNLEWAESNPQFSLLKLMEKDFTIIVNQKNEKELTIPTARILFVFTGAFSRLEESLRAKYQKTSVGFLKEAGTDEEYVDYLSLATTDDFISYGMLPELLGRIGSRCYLPQLTVEDYRQLIKGEGNSIIKLYSNLLGIHGVKLYISDNACIHISNQAKKLKQGARALAPIIHKLLEPAFSEIHNDLSITTVTIKEKDGELALQYGYKGKRHVFMNERNECLDQVIDFSGRLTGTNEIDYLVFTMLECSCICDKKTKECMYNLFKALLYYLKLEVNPEEQNYNSIIKLINCCEADVGEQSVLDVLMGETLKKDKPRTEELKTMQKCYSNYKEGTNRLIEKSIRNEVDRMKPVVYETLKNSK